MFLNQLGRVKLFSVAISAIFLWTGIGFPQGMNRRETVSPTVHLDILQDFHCNAPTQKAIYQYLDDLNRQGKLQGIFQEGASGPIDRALWKKLPSGLRQEVIRRLAQEGWIGGAEQFAIDHPEIPYLGVEEKALYEIHRRIYGETSASQPEAKQSIRQLQQILTQLKSKFYPPQLSQLERDWKASQDGSRLFAFLSKYAPRLAAGETSRFRDPFKKLLEGLRNRKHLEKVPDGFSWDAELFEKDLESFYDLLRSSWLGTEELKRIAKVSDYLELLERLWNLELTPRRYQKFLVLKKTVPLKREIAFLISGLSAEVSRLEDPKLWFAEDHEDLAQAFYELAHRRDKAMGRRLADLLRDRKGHFVLVAGGFHSEGLVRRFEQGSVSFSLISPRFTEIDPDVHEKYARAMGDFPPSGDVKAYVRRLMFVLPEPFTARPVASRALELIREQGEAASLGGTQKSPPPESRFRAKVSAVLLSFVLALPLVFIAPAVTAQEGGPSGELRQRVQVCLEELEQASGESRIEKRDELARLFAEARDSEERTELILMLSDATASNVPQAGTAETDTKIKWKSNLRRLILETMLFSVFFALFVISAAYYAFRWAVSQRPPNIPFPNKNRWLVFTGGLLLFNLVQGAHLLFASNVVETSVSVPEMRVALEPPLDASSGKLKEAELRVILNQSAIASVPGDEPPRVTAPSAPAETVAALPPLPDLLPFAFEATWEPWIFSIPAPVTGRVVSVNSGDVLVAMVTERQLARRSDLDSQIARLEEEIREARQRHARELEAERERYSREHRVRGDQARPVNLPQTPPELEDLTRQLETLGEARESLEAEIGQQTVGRDSYPGWQVVLEVEPGRELARGERLGTATPPDQVRTRVNLPNALAFLLVNRLVEVRVGGREVSSLAFVLNREDGDSERTQVIFSGIPRRAVGTDGRVSFEIRRKESDERLGRFREDEPPALSFEGVITEGPVREGIQGRPSRQEESEDKSRVEPILGELAGVLLFAEARQADSRESLGSLRAIRGRMAELETGLRADGRVRAVFHDVVASLTRDVIERLEGSQTPDFDQTTRRSRALIQLDPTAIPEEGGGEVSVPASGARVSAEVPNEIASSISVGDVFEIRFDDILVKRLRVSRILRFGPDHSLIEFETSLHGLPGAASWRVSIVKAQSLGTDENGMSRRQFLGLCALAGFAAATGCKITDETIGDIRRDPGLGLPNSLITKPGEVTLSEIIVSLARGIAEVPKNADGEPVFKSFFEYVPERSYHILGARHAVADAEGQAGFMSGFSITPQMQFSWDFTGTTGINGGFVFQLPRSLGGGTLYIPIGVNSLEEDLKAAVSFVSSVQNLVLGLGDYFSEMNQIAVREARFHLLQAILGAVSRAENLYRELAVLSASIKKTQEFLQIWEGRDLSSERRELAGLEGAFSSKLEELRNLLHLHPDIQITFDNFRDVNLSRVETFTVSAEGMNTSEILRRLAKVDKRVGIAHDRFTALAYLSYLEERRAHIPDVFYYIFGGLNVRESDLAFANDQNKINFIRRAIMEGGLYLRGPDLWQYFSRLWSETSSDEDRVEALRTKRVELIDHVWDSVLVEIRAAWTDWSRKKADLVEAQTNLARAKQELVDLILGREAGRVFIEAQFAKEREILALERALAAKWLEYTVSLRTFQGYFPDRENWTRNKLSPEQLVTSRLEEGTPYLEDMRRFVESPIRWQSSEISLEEFAAEEPASSSLPATGRALGMVQALGLKWDRKRVENILYPQVFAKASQTIVLFLEERDLSTNPGFLTHFLKRGVRLEIFTRQEEWRAARYFPKGISENVRVHFYNEKQPLYAVMTRRIQEVTSHPAGISVILSQKARLFSQLSLAGGLIKVCHPANYPQELMMELARRVGAVEGQLHKLVDDERLLIRYDKKRRMFHLFTLEKLLKDLFLKVARDYHLKIAA